MENKHSHSNYLEMICSREKSMTIGDGCEHAVHIEDFVIWGTYGLGSFGAVLEKSVKLGRRRCLVELKKTNKTKQNGWHGKRTHYL